VAGCTGYHVCVGYAGWICYLGYIYMLSMLLMMCGYANYAVKICCLTYGYAAYAGCNSWINGFAAWLYWPNILAGFAGYDGWQC
jgi:hypothetical protein